MLLNAKTKTAFWIFILAFAQCFFVHQANRFALIDAGVDLREGTTVITADDASYLVPAENALRGKGWRTNDPGTAAYVMRSPGYGLVWFVLRSALPPPAALWCLFLLQVALFAWAAALVPSIAGSLGLSQRWSLATGLAVALLPTFSGFLSYTLTEGLVPSLVMVFLWLLLKGFEGSGRALFFASLLLGYVILIRVPMLVWLIAFVVVLFAKSGSARGRSSYRLAAICVFLSLSPLAVWHLHGSLIAGKVIGLHPVYHWDSNDLYRPIHKEIWGFHKMWGQSGADFHHGMNTLWDAALSDAGQDTMASQSDSAAVAFVVGQLPAQAFAAVSRDSLRRAYGDYLSVLKTQAPYHEAGRAMPTAPTSFESDLMRRFARFREEYRAAEPLHALITVPLDVYISDLSAHSNLSLYIFQAEYRGRWWAEAIRYLSFALHCGVFLAFPVACIFAGRRKKLLIVALPVAVYLFYLAFVQRGVEERYTLPVLVPALLVVAVSIQSLVGRFRKRGGKQQDFSKLAA